MSYELEQRDMLPGNGSWCNPIDLPGAIPETYPEEYADRPYIYVRPAGGSVTKWYRSYSDYCD